LSPPEIANGGFQKVIYIVERVNIVFRIIGYTEVNPGQKSEFFFVAYCHGILQFKMNKLVQIYKYLKYYPDFAKNQH